MTASLSWFSDQGGDTSWMADALCKGQDPSLWFHKGDQTRVLAVCRSCPVMQQCRTYAQHQTDMGHPLAGVWGATTERQRAKAALREPSPAQQAEHRQREQRVIDLVDLLLGPDVACGTRQARRLLLSINVAVDPIRVGAAIRTRNERWPA